MNVITLILAIFFSVLCFGTVAQGKNLAGQMLLAAGEVYALREGKKIRLKRRSQVFVSDTIELGERSKAQIRFVDGAVLSLYANSVFKLKDYGYDENNPEKNASKFQLVKGALRSLTGKVAEKSPDKYRITTRIATVGVRGTIVKVGLEGSGKSITQYTQVEGSGERKIFVSTCNPKVANTEDVCEAQETVVLAAGTAFNSSIVRLEEEKVDIDTGANLGEEFFEQTELDSVSSIPADETDTPIVVNNTSTVDTTVSAEAPITLAQVDTSSFEPSIDDISTPTASVSNELNNETELNEIATQQPVPAPVVVTPPAPTDEAIANFLGIAVGNVNADVALNYTNVGAYAYEGGTNFFTGLVDEAIPANGPNLVSSTTNAYPVNETVEFTTIDFAVRDNNSTLNSQFFLGINGGGLVAFGELFGTGSGGAESPEALNATTETISDTFTNDSFYWTARPYTTLPAGTVTYTNLLNSGGYEINGIARDLQQDATVLNISINFATNAVSGNFSFQTPAAATVWSSGAITGTLDPTNGNFTMNGTGTISNGGNFVIDENTIKSTVVGVSGRGIAGAFRFTDGGAKSLTGVYVGDDL